MSSYTWNPSVRSVQREGVGDGWSFLSSRKQCAVHSAHRLELIPPQVPLDEGRGRSWGDGGGSYGARAATSTEVAQQSGDADTPRTGVSANDVTPSNATGAADEPVLPDQRSGPASGVAGDRGDGLRDEPRGTAGRKRIGPQAVKRARSRAAGGKQSPRSPGTGTAAISPHGQYPRNRACKKWGIARSLLLAAICACECHEREGHT